MRRLLSVLMLLTAALPCSAQQLSFDEAIARLKLPDPAVRLQALRLLEESGYPESGAPIAALLTDPDERIGKAAMYAEVGIFLGTRIETRRKVAAIVEVRDTRPAERLFDAGWASLPIAPAPDEVVTAMLAMTRHPDPVFRLEAIYAFALVAQLDGRAPSPAYREVAEGLAERLGDPAPETRIAVARAAGRVFRRCAGECSVAGLARLGDALVHTLNDPDRRIRGAALGALGDLRWQRSLEALTGSYEYYRGKSEAIPYLATLARIAHPASAPHFKEALTSRDAAARLAGGEGMARIGGEEALAASTALQDDRTAAARVVSAFASARAGQAEGIERLVQATEPIDTRLQAQEYLIEVGTAAAAPVVAALASGSADRRRVLVEVFSAVGDAADLPSIEPLQRDPNARLAAAAERAVARIRARSAGSAGEPPLAAGGGARVAGSGWSVTGPLLAAIR